MVVGKGLDINCSIAKPKDIINKKLFQNEIVFRFWNDVARLFLL